jgi:hypothetical protein
MQLVVMEANGHLFPGQEADAVAQMRKLLVDDTQKELRATGKKAKRVRSESGAYSPAIQVI